jgi:Flp pilus assembly protein TadG
VSLRRLENEKGQALVEFALLVPVLLLIVGGIIQFGKAFSYWSQMNNVASETARQIVVDHLQGNNAPTNQQFRQFAFDRFTGSELKDLVNPSGTPDENHIKICFTPPAAPHKGNEVKVTIQTDNMEILPFVGISPFHLTSSATMRVEAEPDNTVNDPSC